MANMENISDAQLAALKARSQQNGVNESVLYERDTIYPVINNIFNRADTSVTISSALNDLLNKWDKQSEISAVQISILRDYLNAIQQIHASDIRVVNNRIDMKADADSMALLINDRSQKCERNVEQAITNTVAALENQFQNANQDLVSQVSVLDRRVSRHTSFITVTLTGATETAAKEFAYYLCNPTGAQAITLPTAFEMDEKRVWFKNLSANTVTISPANVSETIDGAASIQLTTQYQNVELGCDGTVWHVTN